MFEAIQYPDSALAVGGLVGSLTFKFFKSVPNHAVYFDNLVPSNYLFCLLSERILRETGTVRYKHLREAIYVLASSHSLQKYDYDYFLEQNNKLSVARGQNN